MGENVAGEWVLFDSVLLIASLVCLCLSGRFIITEPPVVITGTWTHSHLQVQNVFNMDQHDLAYITTKKKNTDRISTLLLRLSFSFSTLLTLM